MYDKSINPFSEYIGWWHSCKSMEHEVKMTTQNIIPLTSTLCKLGSIVVHVQEILSKKGHNFDVLALQDLVNDAEVNQWLEEMNRLALVPVKRSK
jgi:ribosome biogenesis GTPase A